MYQLGILYKDNTINRKKIFNPYIAIRFLAEFTYRASTLITFPLMAKYLGTEGYGINSQTNTLITFCVPIATLGMGYGIVRLIAGKKDTHDVSSRFYSSLSVVSLASILIGLVIFSMAPLINAFFIKVDYAVVVIRWSSPLILLTAVETTIKDFYRARLRIISYSIFQIAQTITYVGGVTLVLINGGGLLQVVWLWLGIKTIFNISTYIFLIAVKEIELIPSFMPRAEMTSLLIYGFPIVIAGFGTWITNVGDRWVIGYFLTINDVAIYNAAYTLAGIITALAAPFWNPLYPLMSSYLNDKDEKSLFGATRKYVNGFSIITIPAVAGLTVLANPLLILFGSQDFSIKPIIFSLIILGLFMDQFSASMHYLVYLHNEPHFIRDATIISGVSNIILNLVTVPWLGIAGAALSTFITFFILDFMLFRRVISYGISIKKVYDFHAVEKYLFASVIMAFIVSFLSSWFDSSLKSMVILTLSGMVVYGISLLSFYNFKIRDLIHTI